MGFFSWECAKCGEAIYNRHSEKKDMSSCYLITPNNTIYEPNYEGYDVFGGVDIYELLGDGDRDLGIDRYFATPPSILFDIKVVHEKCFHKDKYEELAPSNHCSNQGFFISEKDSSIK
jgi:formylmethanofuran dehydrogenase subunit E